MNAFTLRQIVKVADLDGVNDLDFEVRSSTNGRAKVADLGHNGSHFICIVHTDDDADYVEELRDRFDSDNEGYLYDE